MEGQVPQEGDVAQIGRSDELRAKSHSWHAQRKHSVHSPTTQESGSHSSGHVSDSIPAIKNQSSQSAVNNGVRAIFYSRSLTVACSILMPPFRDNGGNAGTHIELSWPDLWSRRTRRVVAP